MARAALGFIARHRLRIPHRPAHGVRRPTIGPCKTFRSLVIQTV